jgi:hypothetical protein
VLFQLIVVDGWNDWEEMTNDGAIAGLLNTRLGESTPVLEKHSKRGNCGAYPGTYFMSRQKREVSRANTINGPLLD